MWGKLRKEGTRAAAHSFIPRARLGSCRFIKVSKTSEVLCLGRRIPVSRTSHAQRSRCCILTGIRCVRGCLATSVDVVERAMIKSKDPPV